MIADYLDRVTEPSLPAIDISERDTLYTPVAIYQSMRDLQLRCWLYLLCQQHGGSCSGSLSWFARDARQCGLLVALSDLQRMHGQVVGNGRLFVLVCESKGCETYLFVIWEQCHD